MNKTVLILTGVALTAGAAYLVFKPKGTTANNSSANQVPAQASVAPRFVQRQGSAGIYEINGTDWKLIRNPDLMNQRMLELYGDTTWRFDRLPAAEYDALFATKTSLSGLENLIPLG